jgi:hypothetical protein
MYYRAFLKCMHSKEKVPRLRTVLKDELCLGNVNARQHGYKLLGYTETGPIRSKTATYEEIIYINTLRYPGHLPYGSHDSSVSIEAGNGLDGRKVGFLHSTASGQSYPVCTGGYGRDVKLTARLHSPPPLLT